MLPTVAKKAAKRSAWKAFAFVLLLGGGWTGCSRTPSQQPPASDHLLRDLLQVRSLGGQYQPPANQPKLLATLFYFEKGRFAGSGPIVVADMIHQKDDSVAVEALWQTQEHQTSLLVSMPGNVVQSRDDLFLQRLGTNFGTSRFFEAQTRPQVGEFSILGFMESGKMSDGSEPGYFGGRFEEVVQGRDFVVALAVGSFENQASLEQAINEIRAEKLAGWANPPAAPQDLSQY